MAKNLVLFSDGTGNSAGKLFKTNVWRVFQALDLKDPQHPEPPRQFAYYDDGVGTSGFKPLALLGGAFGIGLSRNVRDLYVFLCRMYEPGDDIYVFGFSRGAFTIRVLVGMVVTQGLLRYQGNEAELQRLAHAAYRAYRAQQFKGWFGVRWGRQLRDAIVRLKNRIYHQPVYADIKSTNRKVKEIAYMGLWDTVDAYGLPIDVLTDAIDKIVPLTMRDYRPYDEVKKARHALALDDERGAFKPRLWSEGAEATTCAQNISEERISQVWFAGMHSNIGGGYPEDSLSHVALEWIMKGAATAKAPLGSSLNQGLRFAPTIWAELEALSDENGTLYDSRRGIASYYAYKPRRIEHLAHATKVQVPVIKIHESVLRRIQIDPDGYAPIVIPPQFWVVRIDGSIVSAQEYLTHKKANSRLAGPQSDYWLDTYAQGREQVFDLVWVRRFIYFLTLFFSMGLLTMPLFFSDVQACTSALCFLLKPIQLLDYVLPSFATAWTQAFAYNPWPFGGWLVGLGVCMWLGKMIDRNIRDRMRQVWYRVSPLKPGAVEQMPREFGKTSGFLRALRTSKVYNTAHHVVSAMLLPGLFLLLVFVGMVVLAMQVWFSASASGGALCQAPAEDAPPPASIWFEPRQPCQYLGVTAAKGVRYRISLTIPPGAHWKDLDLYTSPNGFSCPLTAYQSMKMSLAVPLRRHLNQPWFVPVVKVGGTGNDTYVLSTQRQGLHGAVDCTGGAAGTAQVFSSEIVARSDGPMFIYVNDSVMRGLDGSLTHYANNSGGALVQVHVMPHLAR